MALVGFLVFQMSRDEALKDETGAVGEDRSSPAHDAAGDSTPVSRSGGPAAKGITEELVRDEEKEVGETEEVAALKEENEALKKKVEELSEQVRKFTAPAPRSPEVFRFGLGETTPVFDKADWKTLSGHVRDLSAVMPALAKDISGGGRPSDTTVRELQKHNMPLARFAIQAAAEVPGTGPNGSYTHPAVIANLVRAALLNAGNPLTEEQEIAVRTLGDSWAYDVERNQKTYPENTPALTRTADEVDAKLRFMHSLKKVLTPSQRELLFNPGTEGKVGLDLFSPALVYIMRDFVTGKTREELEGNLIPALFAAAGVTDVPAENYAWVARQWVEEVPGASEPRAITTGDRAFPHVDQLQTAARAEVAAVERIVGMGGLEEENAKKLLAVSTILLPQVIE
jgi:hypothetical protein